jgi:hypothetical protein
MPAAAQSGQPPARAPRWVRWLVGIVREYDPLSRTWTVRDYDAMSAELRQLEGVSRIAGDKD